MSDLLISEKVGLWGHGSWELQNEDGSVVESGDFRNIITQAGDTIYGERGWMPTGAPAAPTGMQLGTGTTAAAKTGAGAAIVTYITGSARGFTTGWPVDSLVSTARQVQYKCSWPAGVATNSAVIEFVLINQAVATDSGAAAANTLSRVKIGASINKASDKILIVIWNHVFLGA